MGKTTINGSFSIAMLNYQRVGNSPTWRYDLVILGADRWDEGSLVQTDFSG